VRILSSKAPSSYPNNLRYLKGSQGASSMANDEQQQKEEETKSLIEKTHKSPL
jgi:hypothetical protein